MKDKIIEEVAKDISAGYCDVLICAFEEEQKQFPITMTIIDFISNLREKNIVYNLGDIFNSTFLDKMNVEVNKYIGK